MTRRLLSFIILSAAIPQMVLAQDNICSIKGMLCDSIGNPITDVVSVVVMNKRDSTTVKWEYAREGNFKVSYSNPQNARLGVLLSATGYKSRFVDINKSNEDLGRITMATMNYKIDEVVVTGKARVKYVFEHGKDAFSIPPAIGEREFDLNSLLTHIPGLEVDGNSVKITGLGAPTYTINGLKPRPGELDNLRPRDIVKIEIDRMPTAKYGKEVVGVVDIITRKDLKDYLSFDVTELFQYNGGINNIASASVNYKKGKWTNYLSYINSHSESKLDMDYNTILYSKEDEYHKTTLTKERTKNLANQVIYSPKFQINKKSFIDAQYTLSWLYSPTKAHGLLDFVGLENNYTNDKIVNRGTEHNMIVRYSNRFSPNHTLVVNAGYYRSGDFKKSEILETTTSVGQEPETETTNYNSNFTNTIFTSSVDYNFRIAKKFNVGIGGEFGEVWNKSITSFINGPEYRTETEDTQAALYLSFSQSMKKFNYQIGLRGEYLYRHDTDDENENKYPFSFLPSVGFTYKFSDTWNSSIYFRRTTTHPTMRQINPTLTYANKYEYVQGNPFLKSAINNDITVKIGLPKNFIVTGGYTYAQNMIMQWMELDTSDPKVITSTYRNFNHANTVKASLTWRANVKFYTMNAIGSYEQTFSEIPFRDETVKNIKPKFSIFLQQSFAVTSDIRFLLTAQYNTSYDYMYLNLNESYGINISAMASCFKRRLNIMVSANNLIYKDKFERHRYAHIYGEFKNIVYPRNFGIALSYNFNNLRDLPKNSSNNEILKRAW